MRILQIYDHVGQNCGIMSVIMNWYRNIDRSRFQFDFLVSFDRTPSYEEEIRSLGGNIYYMTRDPSLSSLHFMRLVRRVKAFMKENATKYDAIHLHTSTFAFPYLYYAKKYGAKCRIVHAHSVALGNSRLSSIRNRFLIHPVKSSANYFLACSNAAANCLYSPLKIDNFDIILNGIDFDKYKFSSEKRNTARKALALYDNSFAAVHISNMTYIKNVPFVIHTFAEIIKLQPNAKLFLIGRDELPQGISEAIREYKLEDSVINLGVRTDVPELLQAFDVCLMPSRSEGLGLVAVECQASGLPVITSTGFPDDIYVTELAVKCELNEYKWALAALDIAGRRSLDVDLTNAAEVFDIKNITRQLERYYRTTVGG